MSISSEIDYKKVINCCICNSNDLEEVLDMRKTPLANNLMKKLSQSTTQKNYSLGLVICKNCNHIQLNTEINPSTKNPIITP